MSYAGVQPPSRRDEAPVVAALPSPREQASTVARVGASDATPEKQPWRARLSLELERVGEATVLVRRSHEGPLCVQRPHYAHGDSACQLILLHPPGGLVGGDELQVEARLGPGAHALLTTPAASKLYRTDALPCAQRARLHVAAGSRLEWLPQESIAFDGAIAELSTRIELEGDARLLAWELTCLGRPACGERFEHGRLRVRFEVVRDGEPLLIERGRYDGGSALLREPWGLGGEPVTATLVCVTAARDAALVDGVRELLSSFAAGRAACTELGAAIVCRYRGPSVEQARHAFGAVHGLLRERCFDARALTPRILLT